MAKFTDALSRDWELRITMADLPRLRAAGFDVAAVLKDTKAFGALDDLEVLGRVLWTLCESTARQRGIEPEAFATGFDGPALSGALDAMVEAVTDFTQRPRMAQAMKSRLPAKFRQIEDRAIEQLEELMATTPPPTPSGSIASGGSSVAPPESTPPVAPFWNSSG